MSMVRCVCVLTLLIAVAACSIHPLPGDVTPYSTDDIVAQIRCEAQRAVNTHASSPELSNASIAYTFEFTITENNNGSATASFRYPFSGGTFNFGVGAGEDKRRAGKRTITIGESFAELRKLKCAPGEPRPHWRYPITGRVGLDESIATFVEINKPNGTVDAFTDKLTFTTTIFGTANPQIELSPVMNQFRLIQASAALRVDRTDVHDLQLAIVPGKPGAGRAAGFVAGRPVSSTQRAIRELERQRSLGIQEDILRRLDTPPLR